MIELTFTLKTNTINEALDALTEIYLRTENEELQKQCEEYREKLASDSDREKEMEKVVPRRTKSEVLLGSGLDQGSEDDHRKGHGDKDYNGFNNEFSIEQNRTENQ